MPDATSRYSNNAVQAVTDASGITRQTIMPNPPSVQSYSVMDYAWTGWERIDLVAARMYGDDTMWWVIANANPEILDWTSVTPGTIVRIPSGLG